MAYLIMRRGPEPGKLYRLDADEIQIGRGSKNNIIIHDNEVSREHLILKRVPEGFELRDLKSSNGTFVNGQPVDRVWLLRSQCIVELGDSITLGFYLGDPDGADSEDDDEGLSTGGQPAYLVVTVEGQEDPAVYPLDKMTVTVGRSTSCDVMVVEPEMSREHFRLTVHQQGYTVQDLNSTNGTMVNGENIREPRLVVPGDNIQVGKSIRFQVTESPETFAHLIRTDLLVDTKELVEKTELMKTPASDKRRSTSDREIPAIVMGNTAQEPSEIGTGLDDISLRDQVLISYAREDWTRVVAPMVDKLYDAQIGVWVDQYLTLGSSDWLIATEQARLECWLLVVVVSPNAMRSDAVRRNWRHFQNREKPILLLMVDPVDRLPVGAKTLTRISYNPAVPHVAFDQLALSINKYHDRGR